MYIFLPFSKAALGVRGQSSPPKCPRHWLERKAYQSPSLFPAPIFQHEQGERSQGIRARCLQYLPDKTKEGRILNASSHLHGGVLSLGGNPFLIFQIQPSTLHVLLETSHLIHFLPVEGSVGRWIRGHPQGSRCLLPLQPAIPTSDIWVLGLHRAPIAFLFFHSNGHFCKYRLALDY